MRKLLLFFGMTGLFTVIGVAVGNSFGFVGIDFMAIVYFWTTLGILFGILMALRESK